MEKHANDTRKMIESLYDDGVELDANWENLGDDVIRRIRAAYATGDEAVQSLLASLAFKKFDSAEQADRVASSLAGIKQRMVAEIFEEFPTTSLDDLREAAQAAGYDIEVMA